MKVISCGFIIRYKNLLFTIHPTNSNFLSIPKGVVDINEDYFDAAKRELQEETSLIYDELDIKNERILGLYPYLKHKNLYLIELMLNKRFDVDNLNCSSYYMNSRTGKNEKEVDAFQWIPFKDYNKRLNISLICVFNEIYGNKNE